MDLEKSYQQLLNRVTENYADYRAKLLLKDRQELIDGADRIAKTAEVFQYFTTKPLTEVEVAYFLNFQNPLEVAADHWANCEFELDALGAVVADTADKADDLTLYPLAADASERGDTRAASEEAHGVPFEQGQPSKPSIKDQLAVKPVPGDHSAAKTKDREVR